MIKVIMDSTDKKKIEHYKSLGYEVNNIVMRMNPEKTWHQVNWSMILSKTTSAVIFDIEKGYSTTKAMIYGALKNNVPVVALLKGQRYNLRPSIIHEPTYDAFNNFIPNEYTTLLDGLKNMQQDEIDKQDEEISISNVDYIKSSATMLGIDIPMKHTEKDGDIPDLVMMTSYINLAGREHDVILIDEEDSDDVLNKYITLKYYEQQNFECFNPEDNVKCPVCGHWTRRTCAMFGMLQCNFCGTDIIKEAGITIEPFGKEGLYEDWER